MIRQMLPFWVWGIVAVSFVFIAVALSCGFTVWWVHTNLANECGALNYILDHGHLSNPVFKNAINGWAVRDGCR